MLIELKHPNFSAVELSDGSLIIHSMQRGPRVLRENVKDLAVSTWREELRLIAFFGGEQAWYFKGEDELESERLELGDAYAGGAKLLTDGTGTSHLFYLVEQRPGPSYLLRHQRFTGSWSLAQTVTANVFPESWAFSCAWHADGYLHLVYLDQRNRHLLYRVYSLETGLWSGAVTFAEAACSYPQLLSLGKLYLFWLEEGGSTFLKVRPKGESWEAPVVLSGPGQHAANLGFVPAGEGWSAVWGEGSGFYQAPLDHWNQRKEMERDQFAYIWAVQEGVVLPIYRKEEPAGSQVEEGPEPTGATELPPEQPTAEPERVEEETGRKLELQRQLERELELERERQRRAEEAKAQAAFMEQAFQTLKEWERVREEVERWRRELKAPEPVDLTPILSRLERLERRFFTLKQGQDQQLDKWEARTAQLEQELFRTRGRLRELEEREKHKPKSLWRRVLGRG